MADLIKPTPREQLLERSRAAQENLRMRSERARLAQMEEKENLRKQKIKKQQERRVEGHHLAVGLVAKKKFCLDDINVLSRDELFELERMAGKFLLKRFCLWWLPLLSIPAFVGLWGGVPTAFLTLLALIVVYVIKNGIDRKDGCFGPLFNQVWLEFYRSRQAWREHVKSDHKFFSEEDFQRWFKITGDKGQFINLD